MDSRKKRHVARDMKVEVELKEKARARVDDRQRQKVEGEDGEEEEEEEEEEEDAANAELASSSGTSLTRNFKEVTIRAEADQDESNSDEEEDEDEGEGDESKKQQVSTSFKRSDDDDQALTQDVIKNTLLLMKSPNHRSFVKIQNCVVSETSKLEDLRSAIDRVIHHKTKGDKESVTRGFDIVEPSTQDIPQPSRNLVAYASRKPMFEQVELAGLTKGNFRDAKNRQLVGEYCGPVGDYVRDIARETDSVATSTASLIKRANEPSLLTLTGNVFSFVFLGDPTQDPNAKAKRQAQAKGEAPERLQKYLHLFLGLDPLGPDFSVPLVTGQVVVAVINPDVFQGTMQNLSHTNLVVHVNTEPSLSIEDRRGIFNTANGTLKKIMKSQTSQFKKDAVATREAHAKFLAWKRSQLTSYAKVSEENAYRKAWLQVEKQPTEEEVGEEEGGEDEDGDSFMEDGSSSAQASSSGNLDPADGESSKRSHFDASPDAPPPKRRLVAVDSSGASMSEN